MMKRPGAVVAAAEPAARAGLQMLQAGGNAVDAAVATAAMLGVVDPQNCGIGGYGGFAVVDDGRRAPQQVAFNTVVPRRFDEASAKAGHAGALVAPPAVVPGLERMHGTFGRRPWRECWAPAIDAARDGIAIGSDLATALRWAGARHKGLNDGFRSTFPVEGQNTAQGAHLRQPDLARTLEAIAAEGSAAIRTGEIARAIVDCAASAGGVLGLDDLASLDATLAPAASVDFYNAEVFTPDPEQSGAAILHEALMGLEGADIGPSRGEQYVLQLGRTLAGAWGRRDAAYRLLAPPGQQTTHLSVADPDGMLVALTFTHGPTWFGSGLVAPRTGVVLNNGARLYARRTADGAILAQTNLTPTIVRRGDDRYAMGTPGARLIPAVVLQLVIDFTYYQLPVFNALAAARMSARGDGTLEAEDALVYGLHHLSMRMIETREYYGPAAAVRWNAGELEAATDPRFAGACLTGNF